jgi:hypothetical protein
LAAPDHEAVVLAVAGQEVLQLVDLGVDQQVVKRHRQEEREVFGEAEEQTQEVLPVKQRECQSASKNPTGTIFEIFLGIHRKISGPNIRDYNSAKLYNSSAVMVKSYNN